MTFWYAQNIKKNGDIFNHIDCMVIFDPKTMLMMFLMNILFGMVTKLLDFSYGFLLY